MPPTDLIDELTEAIRAASFDAPKATSSTEWQRRIRAILEPVIGPPPGECPADAARACAKLTAPPSPQGVSMADRPLETSTGALRSGDDATPTPVPPDLGALAARLKIKLATEQPLARAEAAVAARIAVLVAVNRFETILAEVNRRQAVIEAAVLETGRAMPGGSTPRLAALFSVAVDIESGRLW